MASSVQHTILKKVTLALNVTLNINKQTLVIYKTNDRFNKVYDSDG